MGYRKDAAKGLGEGTIWIIAIGILLTIIGGVFFTMNVLLAPAKGAGGVIIKNNSAENRIEKQEKFEKLYAKVETNKTLVSQHTKNVAANPDDKTAQQTLLGVQSACVASVETYNAEARKVTSMDWKAADLPDNLTTSGCN
jgi:hypothetical protein